MKGYPYCWAWWPECDQPGPCSACPINVPVLKLRQLSKSIVDPVVLPGRFVPVIRVCTGMERIIPFGCTPSAGTDIGHGVCTGDPIRTLPASITMNVYHTYSVGGVGSAVKGLCTIS